MTDLWSLSGNYLYGLSDSGFVTGSGISSNAAAVSAQASSAYQRQMSISGRRTPTLHAPTNF